MRKMIVILFAGALIFVIAGGVWAQDQQVVAKGYHPVEFSDTLDDQADLVPPWGLNGPDPGQVLFTVKNDLPGFPHPKDSHIDYDEEVDALAHYGDAYFWMIKNNTTNLLISFNGDPGGGVDPNCVWYETAGGPAPGGPVMRAVLWKHNSLSNVAPTDPNFDDLDALETYGPGMSDDAYRASFMGDPVDPGQTPLRNWSVWNYAGGAPVGWFPKDDIVAAITNLGWSGNEDSVDVDALMTSFNEIIFSIRANGNWDGGELVVVTLGNPAGAAFLQHGNSVNHGDGTNKWNTAFDIQTAFGVNTEEVDAIEALDTLQVTIPSLTNWGLLVLLVLLVISGIIVIRHRRRGAVRA